MPNYREAIELKVGPIDGYIDGATPLSEYYGPDSLACHGIRFLDETHAESFFIVPENLAGANARPPMFDRINFVNDGQIETHTDEGDAREHFVKDVIVDGTHIEVVPGHNVAGLIMESMTQAYNFGQDEPKDLLLTGFNFMRYKGLILPNQRLVLFGAMVIDQDIVTFSPEIKVNDERRAQGSKFQAKVVNPLDQAMKSKSLDQHWFLETTAQGFGIAAAKLQKIDTSKQVPVLMQTEKTTMGEFYTQAGDLVVTRFDLADSPEGVAMGNAEIFVNGRSYGTQRRLMVQFFPIEKIAEGIRISTSN